MDYNKIDALMQHFHHAYAQTDGTMKWPNSREGDMLRGAFNILKDIKVQNVDFDNLRKQGGHIVCIRAWMAAGSPEGHVAGTPMKFIFNVEGSDIDFGKFCQSFANHYNAEMIESAREVLAEKTNLNDIVNLLQSFEMTIREKLVDFVATAVNVTPEEAKNLLRDHGDSNE